MVTIYMFWKNRIATSTNLKCNSGVLSVYKLKTCTIIRIRRKAKDITVLDITVYITGLDNIWLNNWVFATEYCIKLEFHDESNCWRKGYLVNERQYNTANGWIIICLNGQSCQQYFFQRINILPQKTKSISLHICEQCVSSSNKHFATTGA